MTQCRVVDLSQDGDDWLIWRRQGIGSSEVGAILGVNPYQSAMDVWREKTGQGRDRADNPHTRRGKRWEPVVRRHYEELYGWPMPPVCVVRDDMPWMRASLDGLRDDHRLALEVKCPTSRNWARLRAAGLHDYWLAQVCWLMAVSGADATHVVVFDAERAAKGEPAADCWHQETVPRDEATIAEVVERCREFWRAVEDRRPPD